MKFDLKINISTEGLIENYKKLDEINLFDDHYDNYHFYLNAMTLLEKNKLCNDIKRLHISIVYFFLTKILEIMNFMLSRIIYNDDPEENVYLRKEIYRDTLKKTKIEVLDEQTVFHLKMAIEKEKNDNCLPYKEKLEKNKKLRDLKEKGFMYMPIRNGIVESYTVKELVKRAITATCLDNSFVPSELREFLLYNITFELSECEEETNEHKEEVNTSQKKDNIDDQAKEENDVDNQTANLELSQIDLNQLAKRTSVIIEAPNSKIKKTLDCFIFDTALGRKFKDKFRTIDVVLNEDMNKRKKTINAFFNFDPDLIFVSDHAEKLISKKTLRKIQEIFAIKLLNIMGTNKHLKKYGVKIAAGTRVKAEENE